MSDFHIEIIPAKPQLAKINRKNPGAEVEFPLIDEFFEQHWEQLVKHECDNKSEYCENSLCFVFPGKEVPSKYDMSNSKARANVRHLIRNHGQSRIARFGDTMNRITVRFNRKDPESNEWLVTVLRRCTIPQREKKSSGESEDKGKDLFERASQP